METVRVSPATARWLRSAALQSKPRVCICDLAEQFIRDGLVRLERQNRKSFVRLPGRQAKRLTLRRQSA